MDDLYGIKIFHPTTAEVLTFLVWNGMTTEELNSILAASFRETNKCVGICDDICSVLFPICVLTKIPKLLSKNAFLSLIIDGEVESGAGDVGDKIFTILDTAGNNELDWEDFSYSFMSGMRLICREVNSDEAATEGENIARSVFDDLKKFSQCDKIQRQHFLRWCELTSSVERKRILFRIMVALESSNAKADATVDATRKDVRRDSFLLFEYNGENEKCWGLMEKLIGNVRNGLGLGDLDLQSIFTVLLKEGIIDVDTRTLSEEIFVGSFEAVAQLTGRTNKVSETSVADTCRLFFDNFSDDKSGELLIADFASILATLCAGHIERNNLGIFEMYDGHASGYITTKSFFEHLSVRFGVLFLLLMNHGLRMKQQHGTTETYMMDLFSRLLSAHQPIFGEEPDANHLISFHEFNEILSNYIIIREYASLLGACIAPADGVQFLSHASAAEEMDFESHSVGDTTLDSYGLRSMDSTAAVAASSATVASAESLESWSLSNRRRLSLPPLKVSPIGSPAPSTNTTSDSKKELRSSSTGHSVAASSQFQSDAIETGGTSDYSASTAGISTKSQSSMFVPVSSTDSPLLKLRVDNGIISPSSSVPSKIRADLDEEGRKRDGGSDTDIISIEESEIECAFSPIFPLQSSEGSPNMTKIQHVLGFRCLSSEFVVEMLADHSDDVGIIRDAMYLKAMKHLIGRHYNNLRGRDRELADFIVHRLFDVFSAAHSESISHGRCDVRDLAAAYVIFCDGSDRKKAGAIVGVLWRYTPHGQGDNERSSTVNLTRGSPSALPCSQLVSVLNAMFSVTHLIDPLSLNYVSPTEMAADIIHDAISQGILGDGCGQVSRNNDVSVPIDSFLGILSNTIARFFSINSNPQGIFFVVQPSRMSSISPTPDDVPMRRSFSAGDLSANVSMPSAAKSVRSGGPIASINDANITITELRDSSSLLGISQFKEPGDLLRVLEGLGSHHSAISLLEVQELLLGLAMNDRSKSLTDDETKTVSRLAEDLFNLFLANFDGHQKAYPTAIPKSLLLLGLLSLCHVSFTVKISTSFAALDQDKDGLISLSELFQLILSHLIVSVACSKTASRVALESALTLRDMAETLSNHCAKTFNTEVFSLESTIQASAGFLSIMKENVSIGQKPSTRSYSV